MWISTITPLSGNATYTSDQLPTDRNDRLTGIVFSDRSGTLDIQHSGDGASWDYKDSVSVTGGTGAKFSVELLTGWVRIVYTNGATAQTTFRLFAKDNSSGDS